MSIVLRRLVLAGVNTHDMPKKVLVTGASGLIGGLIVTRLEESYDFSALTRSAPGDWKCALHFCYCAVLLYTLLPLWVDHAYTHESPLSSHLPMSCQPQPFQCDFIVGRIMRT